MNKSLSTPLVLVCFLVTQQSSLGQSAQVIPRADLVLRAGAGFPVGDFSGNTTGQLGHASTGFGGSLEYSYHVIEFFDLGLLFNVNYNGFDAEKLASELGTGTAVSATHYLNSSMLGCFGFNVPTTQNIRFYTQGCLGIVRSTSPEITLSGGNTQAAITSATSYAFGYSFAAGVTIFSIDLSLRYLASEPEYHYKDQNGQDVHAKQPTGIIQMSVGYAIPL